MSRIVQLLRSARFALAVILFIGIYAAAGAWLPWSLPQGGPPPEWAVRVGLDRPFVAWPFLVACALLFASTLACTWGRRRRVLALRRGTLPPSALALATRPGADLESFLRERGFRGADPVLHRHGFALWGGWVFHVALLVLIAGVVVQQAFHDGGTFHLTVGETAALDAPGAVIGREAGPLASASPPAVEVTLTEFDPFLHQPGYAPDRLSTIRLATRGGSARSATLDRAAGIRLGDVEVFQAIPTGLALNLEFPGAGIRSVHLRGDGDRRAVADVLDPAGVPARFVIESERPLLDPDGTGRLAIALEAGGRRRPLEVGLPFDFGPGPVRIREVSRWGAFTYARSPAIPAVVLGFVLVVAGSTLLAFPASVARVASPGEAVAGWVAGRGTEALRAEWEKPAGGT